ncbi:winged helix-turn-helix domain-containing protein [Enterococcus sp. LJL99]
MEIGFITDCTDMYEKIKNTFQSKNETICLVEDKNQLDDLKGIIIYFANDNYFAKIIENLLYLKTKPTAFLWVGVPKLLDDEENILLEMGVNNVFSFPDEIKKSFYIVKNAFNRISVEENIELQETSKKLVLNENNQSVIINNEERSLTRTEYKVFSLLINQLNNTVTYDELAKTIWGNDSEDSAEVRPKIANIIFHVREKIESGIFDIVTTRGKGYILKKTKVEN